MRLGPAGSGLSPSCSGPALVTDTSGHRSLDLGSLSAPGCLRQKCLEVKIAAFDSEYAGQGELADPAGALSPLHANNWLVHQLRNGDSVLIPCIRILIYWDIVRVAPCAQPSKLSHFPLHSFLLAWQFCSELHITNGFNMHGRWGLKQPTLLRTLSFTLILIPCAPIS